MSWLYLATRSERAGASLDLSHIQCNCQVGDGCILSLTRTMRGDRPPAGTVTGLDRFDAFRSERTDLIEFDQQGVGRLFLDSASDTLRLVTSRSSPDDLDFVTEVPSSLTSMMPSHPEHAVFNGDDRIIIDPVFPEFDHLSPVRSLPSLRRLYFFVFSS